MSVRAILSTLESPHFCLKRLTKRTGDDDSTTNEETEPTFEGSDSFDQGCVKSRCAGMSGSTHDAMSDNET